VTHITEHSLLQGEHRFNEVPSVVELLVKFLEHSTPIRSALRSFAEGNHTRCAYLFPYHPTDLLAVVRLVQSVADGVYHSRLPDEGGGFFCLAARASRHPLGDDDLAFCLRRDLVSRVPFPLLSLWSAPLRIVHACIPRGMSRAVDGDPRTTPPSNNPTV